MKSRCVYLLASMVTVAVSLLGSVRLENNDRNPLAPITKDSASALTEHRLVTSKANSGLGSLSRLEPVPIVTAINSNETARASVRRSLADNESNLTPAANATDSVTYTYDSLNRLVRAEYNSGNVITYSYDAAGNRTAQQISASGTPTPTPSPTPTPTASPTPTPTASPTPTATPTPIPSKTIQFGSSFYTVNEGSGLVNVTVNRSGDASEAATVSYATSDGIAREGRDYVASIGALTFAAGETTKNFTVLIIDNAFVDGPRTVNLALSNPTGAVLAAQSAAVLTINDNDSVLGANPVDQQRSFVQFHYYDFFGRYPDQSGWDFWTNTITGCGADQSCVEVKRINASGAFFLSIEFQQTGYLVYRIYKSSFGNITEIPNAPVPIKRAEFVPDTQEMGNGVIVNQGNWEQQLEANKQAFTLEFVQRSRFVTAFPATMTPAQFVDKLFSNASVSPTANEHNTAINEFGGASNTTDVTARSRALRDVAENATLNTEEFNKAFVLMQYFGYLRRNPYDPPESTLDYSGFNFWLGKLNQFGGNYINAEMVKAFITSSEYRQRFGP